MSAEVSSPDAELILRERADFFGEILPEHLNLKACRHGLMLYFNTDLYVGDSITKYGEWAEVETELFSKLVQPGMTVVEAGANIGTHTLALANMVGPAGRVYAFEPQRRIFQLLLCQRRFERPRQCLRAPDGVERREHDDVSGACGLYKQGELRWTGP